MSVVARTQSLSLLRSLLRAGGAVTDYNFRSYAVRRIKEDFRRGAEMQEGSEEAKDAMRKAQQALDMLRRQSAISQMYPADPAIAQGFSLSAQSGGTGESGSS